MKAKKIAIFNHKGGVSKTTTTFNIGWRLARNNKRVLLVDADSQCNLTQYFMGIEKFNEFYETSNTNNIKDALEPAFKSRPKLIDAVDCIQNRRNDCLFLLPGHLDMSENEVQLGLSFQLTESVGALINLPGSFNYLFEKLSEKYDLDYIIIDLNPSLSSINQDLLVSSDYFMVPTSPDIFSYMSIKSLAKFLPQWEKWAKKARPLFSNAEYPLPFRTPKFIGYTINDFNLSEGNPSKSFASLMNKISREVVSLLVPSLETEGMILPNNKYSVAASLNERLHSMRQVDQYCIAEISNFNKLIAESNKSSIPIFELNESFLGDSQKKTLSWFKRLYELMVDKIIILTQYA